MKSVHRQISSRSIGAPSRFTMPTTPLICVSVDSYPTYGRSSENNTSIVVLGPQASPPARFENNQLNCIDVLNVSCVTDQGCAGRGQAGTPAVPARRCSYYFQSFCRKWDSYPRKHK